MLENVGNIYRNYIIYYYADTIFGVQLKKKCFATEENLRSFIESKLYKSIDAVYIDDKRVLTNIETKIEFKEI